MMITIHTVGMMVWKLKDTMMAHGVTRYALQKRTDIAMNTIRSMYDGETQRPDLQVLDRLILALRDMTGRAISLGDLLEFQTGQEA